MSALYDALCDLSKARDERNAAMHSPMVVAAARALCRDHAEVCNVNADDLWNLEAEDFKRMAALALDAAAQAAEVPQ